MMNNQYNMNSDNIPPIISQFIPPSPKDNFMVVIEKTEYQPSGMFAFGSPIFMLFAYTISYLSSFKTTTEQHGPYDYQTAWRLKQLNPSSKIIQISTNRIVG